MMFDDDIAPPLPVPHPVITWPGGKRKLLKHILPLVPEHSLYCEPFGGTLAVFIAKPRSPIEIINDINGDLVAFYRCCKFHLDPLLDEMDLVLNSRQEVEDYRQQRGLTEIQRAARFCIVNVLSFGGTMTGFRVLRTAEIPSRAKRQLAIRALNHRLDHTTIEHVSWEKCFTLYDSAESFFFLDPPYFDAGGAAYEGWSEHELARFCEWLRTMRGKWLLTFQDCPQVRELLAGYRLKPIVRANGIGSNRGKKGRVYHEVLISSERFESSDHRKGASA